MKRIIRAILNVIAGNCESNYDNNSSANVERYKYRYYHF